MTRNLVTGADGFVGQHLVADLLSSEESVVAAVRRQPPELTTLPKAEAERADWVTFDLESRESVRELVRSHEVDRIFHLAGLTSVAKSLEDPVPTLTVNALGTLFFLDELAKLRADGYDPRTLVPGSGDVYGTAAARCRPLTEDCPLEPVNPYAVSKVAQEMLALQYHRAHGLSVVVTRSFNHTGPGQHQPYVAAQLAAAVLRVRRKSGEGGEGGVKVAAPEIRRDFTDVRDVIRAYKLLADRGEPGRVYNVCSGRAIAIGELLQLLADEAGVSVRIETDSARKRRADVPEIVGSYQRLADATGWTPEIDLRQSLRELLAYHAGQDDG